MDLFSVFTYNQHFVAMMNIINAARLNPTESGHKHHIVPRCWFKLHNLPIDNSKDNLVLLTAEEHAKVHKLAYLCCKEEISAALKYAYYMTNNIFKEMNLIGSNNPFFGKHHTQESKALISIKCKEAYTDERRDKLSKLVKGRKMSKESSMKKSLATKGVPKSLEARNNQLNSRRAIALEYKEYKENGGELKWNEYLHSRREIICLVKLN